MSDTTPCTPSDFWADDIAAAQVRARHADRDRTEPPIASPTDERLTRYAEAIGWAVVDQFQAGSTVHDSLTGFDWTPDVVRAVLPVADAEQADLLQRSNAAVDRARMSQAQAEDAETAATTRAEAAERALADERTEVNRLRELIHVGAELDNHHNAAACPYCSPAAPEPTLGLDGLADDVWAWHVRELGEGTTIGKAAKVGEEAGELIGHVIKSTEPRPDAAEHWRMARLEVADVILASLGAARALGFGSVDELVLEKWAIVRERRFATAARSGEATEGGA